MALTIKKGTSIKWKDLEVGGFIYGVHPITQEIVARPIIKIGDVPGEKAYIEVEFHKFKQVRDLNEKTLELIVDFSADINKHLPTKRIWVEREGYLIVTAELIPKAYASDKQKLIEWINQTPGKIVLGITK